MNGVPPRQPLQLNASNQFDPAQLVHMDSLLLILMPKKDHQANGMPLSEILPSRRSSSPMFPLCNRRLNTCRLIHCHHCHCGVRCRRCCNCHGRSNFVIGMQRSIEWPADQLFQRRFVFQYYGRLIAD
jgi:hypothetical protein